MMENKKNKVIVKDIKKPYKRRGGDCKLKLRENGRNNMKKGVHVTSNNARSCWPTMLVRSHGAQCCKYALRLVLTCHLFFFVTFTYTNPLTALLILIPKTSQR